MASPDWEDPLAYLDSSQLFDLIVREWKLFEFSLLDKSSWTGRVGELLTIRNRIAHLRRPHADDIGRLEQTLRDLEPGAFGALASYNRTEDPDVELDDPVVESWVQCRHDDARRLVDHASRNYGVRFWLSYTVRPWADSPLEGQPISGSKGLYWRAWFVLRERPLDVSRFWTDSYLREARTLLTHVLISSEYSIGATFPAVDDAHAISDAIGSIFDAILSSLGWPRVDDWRSNPLKRLPALDTRVQIMTPWSIVDETTTPISIFSA